MDKLSKKSAKLLPLILAFFALWMALTTLGAVAQSSGDADVQFYIKSQTQDPDAPRTVGDQLTLRLEVIHPTDSRVSLPQVGKEWGDFHVIEQSAPQETNRNDGTSTTGKNIVVTLFQPGFYKTPALIITHRKVDGEIEELASPIIQLRVTSIITDEDEAELQDLKGQATIPLPLIWPWVVGSILLAVGLIFAAVWAVWYFYIKRREPPVELESVPVPVIDARPPEIIAYAELERISMLNLPAKQKIKEHYVLVSDCIRQYAENRYNIPVLEQTTGEFNSAMRKNNVPTEHVGSFMRILTDSDLVKFAKHNPQEDEANALVDDAKSVVAITTPKSEKISLEKIDSQQEVQRT